MSKTARNVSKINYRKSYQHEGRNPSMTLSNKDEMRVDICSECHPFFTGQQKFANRGGRVEKFKNKYNL